MNRRTRRAAARRAASIADLTRDALELRRLRKRAAELADLEHRLRVHAEAGRLSPLELRTALDAPPDAVEALLEELDH